MNVYKVWHDAAGEPDTVEISLLEAERMGETEAGLLKFWIGHDIIAAYGTKIIRRVRVNWSEDIEELELEITREKEGSEDGE